jgi:poly-gamma-glutamate synthesis protein (capsule biosynthesis protein)
LANNHFYDYGEEGVANTLEECENQGFDVVGGGRNLQEASKILYIKLGGKTLAVINCCEHEFSIATETRGGSNPLNPIQQYYAIQEAKEFANYVLIIVHGGHEHFQLPTPRMQETYRFFIDAGADAVINHHQHCYSGYEVYKDKPIFYGIGNFCFDRGFAKGKKWYEGYLVSLHLDEKISFDIIPYNQCSNLPQVHLLEMNSFDSDLKKLNMIISDPMELNQAIAHYYESCASYYSEIFEPCNNRYYLACKRRGWLPSLINDNRKLRAENYICCEAHRDKLIYYLNHK